jgi:putative transcriptional regulator
MSQLIVKSKELVNRGSDMDNIKQKFDDAFAEGLLEILEQNRRDNGALKGQPLVPPVNVKDLREAIGISQDEFASVFGIPVATLRNWEQDRSQPDTPTRRYLYLISKLPKEVAEAYLTLPRT